MSHINTRRQGKPRRTACAIVRKKGKTFNKLKDMTRHRQFFFVNVILITHSYTKLSFFNRLLSLNVYSLE